MPRLAAILVLILVSPLSLLCQSPSPKPAKTLSWEAKGRALIQAGKFVEAIDYFNALKSNRKPTAQTQEARETRRGMLDGEQLWRTYQPCSQPPEQSGSRLTHLGVPPPARNSMAPSESPPL